MPATQGEQPRWHVVLRALREARGLTREGWAARLGYSRATVARWESGAVVPTADAERALISQCVSLSLFRTFDYGPLKNLALTPNLLADLLAEARLTRPTRVGRSVGPPGGAPGGPSVSPISRLLPVTSFVGREGELDELRRLLRSTRLLTLTGPGGVGKTRLALQLAADAKENFADGVAVVSLAAVTDADLMLPTIAHTVGVQGTQSQPLVASLYEYLHDRELLLVWDNFEQVLPAALSVVDLLASAPRLTVLVTSRAVLRLQPEQQFSVPPLGLPDRRHSVRAGRPPPSDAVQLFAERAQAVLAHFSITDENAEVVAEICHRLDGLPLAIELAAARMRLLPPQGLLAGLEQRLTLLTGGARDQPIRHQTLRDALAWSYNLLTLADQQLFRGLAVFAGGFTLEAAEAVCPAAHGRGTDIYDAASALLDNSLLQADSSVAGKHRLTLLETIREFGLEQLAAKGEEATIRERHASYFLAFAEAAEPHLRAANLRSWLERLDLELDNLRAALRWFMETQDAESAGRLIWALYFFWYKGGHLDEGRSWAETLLALPSVSGSGTAHPRALHVAGALGAQQGDLGIARARMTESVALARAAGDLTLLAYALGRLGRWLLDEDRDAAWALLEESETLFRSLGDRWGRAWVLTFLGGVALRRGDHDIARALLQESLTLARETGDPWCMTLPLGSLAQLAQRRGELDRARAFYEEGVNLSREMGTNVDTAMNLNNLARLLVRQGKPDEAWPLIIEAIAICRQLNTRGYLADALGSLAELQAARGRFRDAAYLFGVRAMLRDGANADVPDRQAGGDPASLAAVRAAIGEETFINAWREGVARPIEQVIANLPADAPSLAPTTSDPMASLTQREREVIALLARGLTNRQIGNALVITEGTAALHVKHILRKLDLHSRAQVAAWAVERGAV